MKNGQRKLAVPPTAEELSRTTGTAGPCRPRPPGAETVGGDIMLRNLELQPETHNDSRNGDKLGGYNGGEGPLGVSPRLYNSDGISSLLAAQPKASGVWSVKGLLIEPCVAALLMDNTLYGMQRPRREHYVKELGLLMNEGKWKGLSTIYIAHHTGTKNSYLIDGQNRLSAVRRSGVGQEFVVVEQWFESEEQIKDRYVVHDVGMQRTMADLLKAIYFGEDVSARLLTDPQRRQVGTAANVWREGGLQVSARTKRRKQVATLKPLIDFFTPAAALYFETIKGSALRKRMISSAIMAMGILTTHFEPERAVMFWTGVSDDIGHDATSPISQAYRLIRDHTLDEVGVSKFVRLLAECWNAYMDERTMPKRPKIHVRNTAPILITCTPFDGTPRMHLTDDAKFGPMSDDMELEPDME